MMANAWIRKDDGRLIVMDNMGIFSVLEEWTIIKPEAQISGTTNERRN